MSHDFNIHDLNSAHRHMEEGYVWHNDPVRSRRYDTPIEAHKKEVGFWRRWFKTYGKVVNHLIDEDVTMTLTPSVAPTKTGQWWKKDTPCDCFECVIGDDVIDFKNDVRISTATTDLTIHGKKYTLRNATLIKIFADNIKDTKNGVWTADYTDVINDIWAAIDEINQEIENIKNEIVNIWNAIKKIQGDITDIYNKIEILNNFMNNFKGGDIETTQTVWTGNISEGQALPISLTTGTYDIGVHSNDIGAYVVRIIWSSESPINHNSIISPYVPASSDGSFWIMQPKLTNASKPVFRVTMVKYDHASQSSSVSNSNNGCQLTSVKRVVVKHIG